MCYPAEKTYKISRQLYNSVVAIRAEVGRTENITLLLKFLTSYCTDFQQLSGSSKLL